MLLEIQISLRCFKNDGAAITGSEFIRLGLPGPYSVSGLDVEEQAATLIGCSLKLDSFKGRGASQRFFQAIQVDVDQFATFLASVDEGSFKSFLATGVKADLLLNFKIDDNMMDVEVPHRLVYGAARLGIPASLLVNPE